MTTVVNVRKQEAGVYIGRPVPRRHFAGSRWQNPFKVGADGTIDEVLAKYRAYILERPLLLEHLDELRDCSLGCWCKPRPCHGDVLVDLIENGVPELPPGVHRYEIPNWHPASVNSLTKISVRQGIRLKRDDRDLIAVYGVKHRIPKALGKRRVDTLIVCGPGQRACDPDAYHKSLLDGLKQARLLINDNAKYCTYTEPRFVRSDAKSTVITLTDLETETF